MKGKDIAKYIAYASDDIDLVVLTRKDYERLRKKAFFYDDLKKYFVERLTKFPDHDIL